MAELLAGLDAHGDSEVHEPARMWRGQRGLATPRAAVLGFGVGGISYCAYGEWKQERLLRLSEGMTQQQVRSAVGPPDSERHVIGAEFGCTQPGAVTVWTYRIHDYSGVELVFDRNGKLI